MSVESELTPVRWDLLAEVDGWSLQPVIAWLVTHGRRVKGMDDLVGGVASALVEAGSPAVSNVSRRRSPRPLRRASRACGAA